MLALQGDSKVSEDINEAASNGFAFHFWVCLALHHHPRHAHHDVAQVHEDQNLQTYCLHLAAVGMQCNVLYQLYRGSNMEPAALHGSAFMAVQPLCAFERYHNHLEGCGMHGHGLIHKPV